MTTEVVNTRKGDRFKVLVHIGGSFGPSEMTVVDLSLAGMQIVHPQPIRIGTRARVAFQYRDVSVTIPARLVWSHLSQKTGEAGKLLYVSGLHVEAVDPAYAAAINSLFRIGALQQDSDSMERKRARIQEREEARKSQVKLMPPPRPE
jgi:hypothetical protein